MIDPSCPPEAYTHRPEKPFEDEVAHWFACRYGSENVDTQDWQPEPEWYCDIVVEVGYATLYIECESRASEVRPGFSQAAGYSAQSPVKGVPMVIAPKGHFPSEERMQRLRASAPSVVAREFDAEAGTFVR